MKKLLKKLKPYLIMLGLLAAVVLIKAAQNLNLGFWDIPAKIVGWAYLVIVTIANLWTEVRRCF